MKFEHETRAAHTDQQLASGGQAATASSGRSLPEEKKQELQTSIIDFERWLRTVKKVSTKAANKYKRLLFPPPTAEDWIMKAEGSVVSFNAYTYTMNQCSWEYYRRIILHECFHLFVQDLPNKLDAKRLKDDFGDAMMQLLDIQADYYTAMYYKEVQHASLVEMFVLSYEGSKVFGDTKIRGPKLERFIGSVLSIADAYFKNPGMSPPKENVLYLPNISTVSTEETMHVMIARKDHLMLADIRTCIQDLTGVKNCYANVNGAGVREYVEVLLSFASKALNQKIPDRILKDLYKLSHSECGDGKTGEAPPALATRHWVVG